MRRRDFIILLSGAVPGLAADRAYRAGSSNASHRRPFSRARRQIRRQSCNYRRFHSCSRRAWLHRRRNMAFERKFADGDANKLRALAQELVAHGVDATVALSTPVARAAKQATSVIPIVAIGS